MDSNILKEKKLYFIILFLVLVTGLSAQKQSDLDLLYWSDRDRITLDDFGIQSANAKSGLSSIAFSLEYNVHGLSFFTKNFNKKVRHYMLRSASQIDTSGNVEQYIRYQQALFDIQEIYVRKFRKALRENRKKLLLKTEVADELKEQIIDTNMVHKQTQYNNETNSGKDYQKQQEWETIIKKELDTLRDYAYDK